MRTGITTCIERNAVVGFLSLKTMEEKMQTSVRGSRGVAEQHRRSMGRTDASRRFPLARVLSGYRGVLMQPLVRPLVLCPQEHENLQSRGLPFGVGPIKRCNTDDTS